MAHTVALLALMDEFPNAFTVPAPSSLEPSSQALTEKKAASDHQDPLMALVDEFPSAFLPSENGTETETSEQSSVSEANTDEAHTEAHTEKSAASSPQSSTIAAVSSTTGAQGAIAPEGYELGLHKQVSTFAWGQIDVYLRYGSQGLTSLWVTVGKSGTEVQSLCEAIARLVNLLLQRSVPLSDIVKEIRGIRGGDSEGLGPHRFLGLADLIGKIIQDAPASIPSVSLQAPFVQAQESLLVSAPASIAKPFVMDLQSDAPQQEQDEPEEPPLLTNEWVTLANDLASASICPDCGAELQQVNGCSGGACVVCGYSSCS